MQPILLTTFKQVITFPEPPPRHIRLALLAAGFTFNGEFWTRTVGTTAIMHPRDLSDILASMSRRQA